jgi:hypothetical protein
MKQSSQIAPQDGVHFVDGGMIPGAPRDAVGLIFILDGKPIAGAWVDKAHGGTLAKPFPEVVEGSWVFWQRRLEATCPDADADTHRPAPRLLELL